MTTRSLTMKLAVPAALGMLIALGVTFSACKKDEDPPPLPAPSVEEEAPPTPLTLAPEEDAGGDADADAKKKGGPYKPRQSLANCCSALKQNAASAPPPTNTYMLAAAGVCEGVVAAGGDRAGGLARIRAAAQGIALPGACH